MWLPAFVCPDCSGGLSNSSCVRCGRRYVERDGIWRFLSPARGAALEQFVEGYRSVRGREGRRRTTADYYRTLPVVDAADPQAAEWRIRRGTYAHLLRRVFAAAPQGMRVLDLGAGCGWLSHRLAELGHRAVAVDVLDDDADGLGAATHYAIRFATVQADFDLLPFAPEQFDLVAFNGSLHYAPDAAATLRGASRMLAPGGALAVMDSPMFEHDRDGEAMVADRPHPVHGAGYLTFARLNAEAGALGLGAVFVASRGPFLWRARRRLAKIRLGRAPAAFGLWVAR